MAVNANTYFAANPDVAAAYQKETYGLSPQDFAEAHWLMHGQNEQRSAPETLDPYFSANTDVAKSYADNRYDMTPDDFAQAHYLLYGTDEQRAAPDALDSYFVNNKDVADAYKANRYDLSPTEFANTHYDLYGQSEQRAAPANYLQAPTTRVTKNNSTTGAGTLTPGSNAQQLTPGQQAMDTPGSGGSGSNWNARQAVGAAAGALMGAGNANYNSSLIKSLRQSSLTPFSTNTGVLMAPNQGATTSSIAPSMDQMGGAFNPQVLNPRAATNQEVADWNAYSTYRTNALNAKTPILSMAEWLAGGKSDGKAPATQAPVDGFAGYFD